LHAFFKAIIHTGDKNIIQLITNVKSVNKLPFYRRLVEKPVGSNVRSGTCWMWPI